MPLSDLLGLMGGEVIAFIGAGGKTTLMNCLAWELAAQGKVVLTTTTKIYYPERPVEDVVIAAGLDDALRQVKNSLDNHRVVAVGTGVVEGSKLNGIPPGWVSSLKELLPVDWVLVEADGASRKPLKGHRQGEPVLPETAHRVVAVTGVDVIGKPLQAAWVHRPEVVRDLTGLALGEPLSLDAVSAVMENTLKLACQQAPSARFFPWINKIDNRELLGLGRRLARLIFQHSGKEVVLGGAMQEREYSVIQVWPPGCQVGAVVLAAGMSTRLPAGKCLLPMGNHTVLDRVLENVLASNADPVVIVVGYRHDQIMPLITRYPVQVAINPDYQLGQSTSLQRGLMELTGSKGVLFCLADQPLVLPEVMDQLIESFSLSPVAVVYPEYQGQRGNPVLFGRDVFSKLLQLRGDEGGRRLIKDLPGAQVRALPVNDPGVLQDIDTVNDYFLVLKSMEDKS
ncbi:MAG: selenium cofactor biosynthesis protein YqeC [Bacillota bacterium]